MLTPTIRNILGVLVAKASNAEERELLQCACKWVEIDETLRKDACGYVSYTGIIIEGIYWGRYQGVSKYKTYPSRDIECIEIESFDIYASNLRGYRVSYYMGKNGPVVRMPWCRLKNYILPINKNSVYENIQSCCLLK